jgi:hypothetical protein
LEVENKNSVLEEVVFKVLSIVPPKQNVSKESTDPTITAGRCITRQNATSVTGFDHMIVVVFA